MISIRRMTQDDVECAAYLERMIFSDPWSEKVYRETLELKDVVYLVAEAELNNTSERKIIGLAGVRNVVGDGEITNVMVIPEYRGNGYAFQILSQLLTEGEKLGVRDFTLEVRQSNASAIRLYEKLGFVTEGIRRGYYEHPKEDALIMWKRKNTNA